MNPRVYEVSSLQDIIEKVPHDRIPQFMVDVGHALSHMAWMRSRGVKASLRLPIAWTDDDDEDGVLVRYEAHFKEGVMSEEVEIERAMDGQDATEWDLAALCSAGLYSSCDCPACAAACSGEEA
jgi:3-deoxy-D-arabino-heptulosonate 7-phosphate (DAHP) synthase